MQSLVLPDRRALSLSQPLIMGILNVTPDSFSDGGRWSDADSAMQHAVDMIAQGADLIDVGGESTRPGSQRVDGHEQMRRVIPVIEAIRRHPSAEQHDVPISIDTTRSVVAAAAINAGASIINDVSAGRDDPDIFKLAADEGAPVVLMHMQGEPANMQADPCYRDVVGEVKAFLLERVAAAEVAGVDRNRIVIDPGIGFGKTYDHNIDLLTHLDQFVTTGLPVLLGSSRKRFMRTICEPRFGDKLRPLELVGATCATTAFSFSLSFFALR